MKLSNQFKKMGLPLEEVIDSLGVLALRLFGETPRMQWCLTRYAQNKPEGEDCREELFFFTDESAARAYLKQAIATQSYDAKNRPTHYYDLEHVPEAYADDDEGDEGEGEPLPILPLADGGEFDRRIKEAQASFLSTFIRNRMNDASDTRPLEAIVRDAVYSWEAVGAQKEGDAILKELQQEEDRKRDVAMNNLIKEGKAPWQEDNRIPQTGFLHPERVFVAPPAQPINAVLFGQEEIARYRAELRRRCAAFVATKIHEEVGALSESEYSTTLSRLTRWMEQHEKESAEANRNLFYEMVEEQKAAQQQGSPNKKKSN